MAATAGIVSPHGPTRGEMKLNPSLPHPVFLRHWLAPMLGVRDEFLLPAVHHQVEDFQGDLTEEVGDGLRNFNDIEVLASAHQLQLHGFVLETEHGA